MSKIIDIRPHLQNRPAATGLVPRQPGAALDEAEARYYWVVRLELRAALAAGDVEAAAACRDELDAIALHSSNATLRRACSGQAA